MLAPSVQCTCASNVPSLQLRSRQDCDAPIAVIRFKRAERFARLGFFIEEIVLRFCYRESTREAHDAVVILRALALTLLGFFAGDLYAVRFLTTPWNIK